MGSVRLTNEQKRAICQYNSKHPSVSQSRLAQWAKSEFALEKPLSQAAISKIISKRSCYEQMNDHELQAKRPRTVTSSVLEEALITWILQWQYRRVALSSEIIKAKGKKLAEKLGIDEGSLDFSTEWLQKFQQRHKIRSFKLHGEGGSVDTEALEELLPELKAKIAEYSREDVYNMDETGNCVQFTYRYFALKIRTLRLFYSMPPGRTIARESYNGSKKVKTRLTLA